MENILLIFRSVLKYDTHVNTFIICENIFDSGEYPPYIQECIKWRKSPSTRPPTYTNGSAGPRPNRKPEFQANFPKTKEKAEKGIKKQENKGKESKEGKGEYP